jgi:hypothetical protein
MSIQPENLKTATRRLVCIALLACASSLTALAECKSSIGSEEYFVHNVRLETLLGGAPPPIEAALQKHRGEKFEDDGNISLTKYFAEVDRFFGESTGAIQDDRQAGINDKKSFYVRATIIKGCVEEVPKPECLKTVKDKNGQAQEKCVDVKLKVRVVPVHTESLSANLLDLARSNRLRFYKELPAGIRIFSPSAWVDNDRDYGATAVVNSSVNLLGLTNSAGETGSAGNTQFQFSFNGRKSLQKEFYDVASSLSLVRDRPLARLNKLGLNGAFIANEQPHGDGIKLVNSIRLGGTIGFKQESGPVRLFRLDFNYRHALNRLNDSKGIVVERNSENAIESRALLDGSIARGFLRGGIWFDAASTSNSTQKSYQRIAATVGYAKEFVLPHKACRVFATPSGGQVCVFGRRNAPRVGVELLLGAGHAWGDVPEYARFFGGNSAGNFLYDAVNDTAPLVIPAGPLIRSFGVNRAGIRAPQTNTVTGATNYWHGNLTLAVPLGTLSRPLIPAEPVTDTPDNDDLKCTGCTSLKEALKNQIAGEKNIFIDAMAVRKLTDKQREDLALEPDDPDNPLTDAQKADLAAAEQAFELERQVVMPQADRLWARITPTIAYIADHADLYSVRPLLMADAARLSDGRTVDQRTRLALGGGIQFNVVVAKFEVGYLRTVRSLPGDQKGNFVIRMLFEKLF